MSLHLVISGPSTAGKTSLMLGLSSVETTGGHSFVVDRTWTTRARRQNESDNENVFVSESDFEQKRPDFLLTFSGAPGYEYGIEQQQALDEKEVRLRILAPAMALRFRNLIEAPTVICSVRPFHTNPERILRQRNSAIQSEDVEDRVSRFYQDIVDADSIADIKFQNQIGLKVATLALHDLVMTYVEEHALSQ